MGQFLLEELGSEFLLIQDSQKDAQKANAGKSPTWHEGHSMSYTGLPGMTGTAFERVDII